MREVSISQLWGRAWDLFKVNWLLLVGLLVIAIIVSLISLINALIAEIPLWLALISALIPGILLWPALVRAGYLVARQGQSSFGEAFRDISLLLKVFVYYLILALIPGILIGYGYMLVRGLGLEIFWSWVGYILLFILIFLAGRGLMRSYRGEREFLVQLDRAFPSLVEL
jgi:hypothetical protein